MRDSPSSACVEDGDVGDSDVAAADDDSAVAPSVLLLSFASVVLVADLVSASPLIDDDGDALASADDDVVDADAVAAVVVVAVVVAAVVAVDDSVVVADVASVFSANWPLAAASMSAIDVVGDVSISVTSGLTTLFFSLNLRIFRFRNSCLRDILALASPSESSCLISACWMSPRFI